MTPEQFKKQIIDSRNQLMQQLLQLCAQDLQKEVATSGGNPLNILLTMRMQIEQLTIDVRTLTTALTTLGMLESDKYAIMLNDFIKARVSQLQESQSKIVIVRG